MQIADESKPLCGEIRGKMEQYRDRLLAFGMQEPVKWKSSAWHWLFFKPAAEFTAFVVNLTGHDGFISVTYGYASTAFTRFAGCENQLADFGVPDEQITLRENIIICDEADEASVNRQIGEFYRRYQDISKDDLLIAVKEKRKAFIQQMAVRLKPLGFRKKANTWTRPLEGEYYLMFNAQKSSFSDEYYFNVYIGKKRDKYVWRLLLFENCPPGNVAHGLAETLKRGIWLFPGSGTDPGVGAYHPDATAGIGDRAVLLARLSL